MKSLLSYLLALALIFPSYGFAQIKVAPPTQVVPPAFLPWDQFIELSQEDRNVYLSYLFYVSAVLQNTKYPNEVIGFNLGNSTARFEFPNIWREVFAPNEAHAWVGVGVRVGMWAARTPAGRGALNSLGRTWGNFKNSANNYYQRWFGRGQEVYPPGKGPNPTNLKDVTPPGGAIVPRGSSPVPARPGTSVTPGGSGSGMGPGGSARPSPGGSVGLGTRLAAAPDHCAEGEVCTEKEKPPTPPKDPAAPVESVNSSEPPPSTLPEYKREKGAACIFGGYPNSYSLGQDGGCKPPKDTLNAKECKGTTKGSNFKCNDFKMAEGNKKAQKLMCVPIRKGETLAELTEKCMEANLKLVQQKYPSTLTKEEYEKLIEQINKQLNEKIGGSLSVKEYCGQDYSNKANEGRQKRECEALKKMLKAVEEKVGTHPSVATVPEATPASPPKVTR